MPLPPCAAAAAASPTQATAAPQAAPALERIWVGADGTVKALYSDNTLLLLASSGASFTHVAARDGSRTVQLTECCLRRHRPAVAKLLAFRNQHLDVPCVPGWLAQRWAAASAQGGRGTTAPPPPLFHAGYPITQVAWPPSACAALDQGLVELPGPQQAVLHSTCRSAQLVLERGGLRFAVSWPLLVAASPAADAGGAGGACYAYVQHTQVFSRKQCPARWQAALEVAVAAADLAAACGVQPWRHGSCGAGSPAAKPSAAAWHAADERGSGSSMHPLQQQRWAPPGCPGSPARAMHDVAAQQQHDDEEEEQDAAGQRSGMLLLPVPSLTPAKLRSGGRAQQHQQRARAPTTQQLLQCVTQLPIADELLQALPGWCQQQQQQLEAGSGADTTSSSTVVASLAGALRAPPPPLRQQAPHPGSNGSSWWLEPSLLLPQDELLQMVWSRDATLIFLQEAGEVEAWLHADESCLSTFQRGAFITHLRLRAAAAAAALAGPVTHEAAAAADGDAADDSSRVYAAAALPPELTVPALLSSEGAQQGGGGAAVWGSLPLGRIALEAVRLRSTMVRVQQDARLAAEQAHDVSAARWQLALLPEMQPAVALAGAPPPPRDEDGGAAGVSLQVVEQQDVDGSVFTAYADGRVRVVFADRTLLSLDTRCGAVRAILPDGSKHCALAASKPPPGLAAYVQPALEFAAWSRTTPVQRAAALRTQALIAAELRSSARMAAICAWGSNPQQVPPDLPTSTAGDADGPPGPPFAPGPSRRAELVEAALARNAQLLERLAC